jgi:hypothetical protein
MENFLIHPETWTIAARTLALFGIIFGLAAILLPPQFNDIVGNRGWRYGMFLVMPINLFIASVLIIFFGG